MLSLRDRAASMDRAPTSITPNRTALTWRRPELKAVEDSVTEGLWRARQEKSMGILDGQGSPFEWEKTMVLYSVIK